MSQPFDPVFGDWYTEKRLGNGTDGRVYLISKEENGKKNYGILKTIRIAMGRNEDKGFNSINKKEGLIPSEENYNKIIKGITDNISTIQLQDNGKHFVKYEKWEVRDTSDGKGKLLLIKLEEMRSLTELLGKFSFTLEETVSLGISLCKSLRRCRDFGYVYPNLKPENILFDRNGVCKLGDFGSFSILEPSKTSIAFKRTQYFSAPELVATGKINATSDTYSLGLVLYTLVNRGRLPFAEMYPQEVTLNGLNRSVQNRVNGLPLPKPKLANDALFAVISKACAFRPQDRYLSPDQMLSDLKSVIEKKPFEEVQYEDIFSSSNKGETELPDEAEAFENTEPVKSESETKEQKPEEIKPEAEKPKKAVPVLRNEITIPNVHPSDYSKGRRPASKRKTVTSVPAYSQNVTKSGFSPEIKKIISLLIAIIIVAVMLVVSVSLRQNNKSGNTISQTTSAQNSEVETNGGPND